MAVEAQRLIAISLCKMASSMAQRGGARLHRSLLVANVLHSAQTVALLNNDEPHPDSTCPVSPDPSGADLDLDLDLESPPLLDVQGLGDRSGRDGDVAVDAKSSLFEAKKYHELEAPSDGSDSDEESELVNLSSCSDASQTEVLRTFAPVVEDLQNSFRDYTRSSDNCNEFQDFHLQSPTRKRSRNDSVDEPPAKHLRFSAARDYPSSSIEPMQTDPWQVTNLVYSFSIGFSGLLHNTDASEFGMSESTSADQLSYGQQSTSDSIISCSTQIREALDTLTRPAIVMTV